MLSNYKNKTTATGLKIMGLNICLTPERTQAVSIFDASITHNLRRMADACGLYEALWRPEELKDNPQKAGDLIPTLEVGLARLRSNKETLLDFSPENGWGTYDDLFLFVEGYLSACKAHPSAVISVSR